jgi:Rrf2 family transcriptional regulator, nitric oxide-sensitive transcriptional repressor
MINQAGEYALRAVVHLARCDGLQPASASDIADATKVPQAYLQKILRTLTKQGLLTAQRGMGGGFKLAKLPSAISVLEVLKACDSGPSRIERCPLGITGHTQLCSLHQLIDQQTASVESTFATTSIADLIDNQNQIRPLCDPNNNSNIHVSLSIPNLPNDEESSGT